MGQRRELKGDYKPVTTVKEIRKMNLATLLRRYRTYAAFAREVRSSAAYITHLMSETTEANVGEKFARKCERHLRLAEGWMDVQHAEPADAAVQTGDQFRRVPLLDLERARKWRQAVKNYTETLPIAIVADGPHVHAYRVTGAANEPDIPQGCSVMVDPDLEPEVGDFVVACMSNGSTVIRQLLREGNTEVLAAQDRRYPLLQRDAALEVLTITDIVRSVRRRGLN